MRAGKKAKLAVTPNPRSAGSLDVRFGQKLRARRLMAEPNLSQADIANALGIAFQQIQMAQPH